MQSRDAFLSQSAYGVAFVSLISSMAFGIYGSVFNAYGSFGDRSEGIFTAIALSSFLFFEFSFWKADLKSFWLRITAYAAIIVGVPDASAQYNAFVWHTLNRVDLDAPFNLIGFGFLMANLMLFRRAAK